MKQFIAVIGNRNSGKSTIIKSLTGCPSSLYHGFVVDNATKSSIYVICSSPQERNLSLSELRKNIKQCVADRKCRGLVMAIQASNPWKRLSLKDIFDEVSSKRSFEMSAFLLDPGRKEQRTDRKEVASRLKEFSPKQKILDGRRFSHITAHIINKMTKIID